MPVLQPPRKFPPVPLPIGNLMRERGQQPMIRADKGITALSAPATPLLLGKRKICVLVGSVCGLMEAEITLK
jgi:hypothetical protein